MVRLTLGEIRSRLKKRNPFVRIEATRYVNSKTKMSCTCLRCGNRWRVRWNDLNTGYGCPRCWLNRLTKMKRRLTLAEIRRRVAKTHPTIRVLGPYKGCEDPIRCLCLECRQEWTTTWRALRAGRRCPRCRPYNKSENSVRRTIERITHLKWPRARPSDVPWLQGMHLDGYNKRTRTAFEFDGDQHRKLNHLFGGKHPRQYLHRQKIRDQKKESLCKRHGVRLIRIPYERREDRDYIRRKLQGVGNVS